MKKVLIFALIMALMAVCFTSLCFAEEVTETAGASVNLTYTEKEQIVKDVLDKLLAEGDELWAEKEPWEVFSGWVRSHIGEIVAGVGGFVTLVGSLLVLFKTNPRFKASIEQFKKSCSGWLENISEGFGKIMNACDYVSKTADKTSLKVERLEKSVLALVTALEDVIKLSGADEGKKEIYIKQIDQAKAAVGKSEASGDEE